MSTPNRADRPPSFESNGLVKRDAPLALRREQAAQALSISEESFDRYVRPSLPVVRLGTLRLYPVAAIEAWLAAEAEAPIEGMTG